MPKTKTTYQQSQRKRELGVNREFKSVTIRMTATDELDLRSIMHRMAQDRLKPYEIKLAEMLDIFPQCNVCNQAGDDFVRREYACYCQPEPSYDAYDASPGPSMHWVASTGYAHKDCAEKSMKKYEDTVQAHEKAVQEHKDRVEAKYDDQGFFNIKCSSWSCPEECRVPRGVETWRCKIHFDEQHVSPTSPRLSPMPSPPRLSSPALPTYN